MSSHRRVVVFTTISGGDRLSRRHARRGGSRRHAKRCRAVPETNKRGNGHRVGRPPAGEAGERVTDYPQVSVRLPAEARDKLLALSQVRGQPQWRLIVESVECYIRDLPADERCQVEAMLGRRQAPDGRARRG